jgi:hypothetical protein
MLIILLQIPITGDSHTESQTVISEAKKIKPEEEYESQEGKPPKKSQTVISEAKKRKPEEESESQEGKPPKKIVTSSSSKLMAFTFKKS